MQQGQLIAGRYRLDQPVGAGGMGEVWRAVDTELDRTVAIKRSTADGADLLREAKIAAGLHHAGVVTLYDSVVEDGLRWLVLEYVPAPSLADLLRSGGKLDPAKVATMGAQLAGAVAAVHAAGVVHRDIKPGNVLVDDHGQAKLTDFGISRRVWNELTATDTGLVAGTPAYLAPEVARGGEPTEASDVYSLGATLFAAVEGEPPFGRADNPLVLLRRVADGTAPPARSAGPLAAVLAAMLRRKAADRPDAAEAHRLLTAVATELTTPIAVRAHRFSRGQVAAVGVVAVAVLVGAAVLVPAAVRHSVPGAAAPAPAPPGKAATLGDLHTADPCGLIDPAVYTSVGAPTVDPEYANFNRCDLLIDSIGGDDGHHLDVSVTMDGPWSDDVDDKAPSETIGRVRVQRPAAEDQDCHRTLVLADDNRVIVDANGEGALDYCELADRGTKVAVDRLNAAEVPRRRNPLPRNSLGWLDACGLLDAHALERVPGVDPNEADHDLGNWGCDWETADRKGLVQLRFDRNPPLTADDGTPITLAGRDSFVMAADEGDDNCAVMVTYRSFPGTTGQTKVEYVRISLFGDQPAATLCTTATALAGDASSHLPRP